MNVKITFDMPETIFSALRRKPDDFIQDMRLAAAIKCYEIKKISQEKGAEIAGVSRSEFIDKLSEFKVSPFQESPEDLERI